MDYQLLDYIPYTREGGLKELAEFCDLEYYDAKHLKNYIYANLY